MSLKNTISIQTDLGEWNSKQRREKLSAISSRNRGEDGLPVCPKETAVPFSQSKPCPPRLSFPIAYQLRSAFEEWARHTAAGDYSDFKKRTNSNRPCLRSAFRLWQSSTLVPPNPTPTPTPRPGPSLHLILCEMEPGDNGKHLGKKPNVPFWNYSLS